MSNLINIRIFEEEALKIAIEALVKQEKIKEILNKRDNTFVGQEFGASYKNGSQFI